MKNILVTLSLLLGVTGCTGKYDLQIVTQTSGPWRTHSYLIYDACSREAALVDPGMEIDSLLYHIEKNRLKVKYLLLTHGHQDHIAGIPALTARYPDARVCYSMIEYDAFRDYAVWKTLYPPESVAVWESDSTVNSLMNMDYAPIQPPEIRAEEGRKLTLGHLPVYIHALPGHSKGSVGYSVGAGLFSGDLLYFQTVGYLDYPLGSLDEIIGSVKRIYALFPDETTIYAGHGPVSTIGSEKKNNQVVSLELLKSRAINE